MILLLLPSGAVVSSCLVVGSVVDILCAIIQEGRQVLCRSAGNLPMSMHMVLSCVGSLIVVQRSCQKMAFRLCFCSNLDVLPNNQSSSLRNVSIGHKCFRRIVVGTFRPVLQAKN